MTTEWYAWIIQLPRVNVKAGMNHPSPVTDESFKRPGLSKKSGSACRLDI